MSDYEKFKNLPTKKQPVKSFVELLNQSKELLQSHITSAEETIKKSQLELNQINEATVDTIWLVTAQKHQDHDLDGRLPLEVIKVRVQGDLDKIELHRLLDLQGATILTVTVDNEVHRF